MTDRSAHPLPADELAVLGERVFCDDELGLEWTALEETPDEATVAQMNARNATVLRTLALVEEHDETQSEDAERAELHRLEAKLDLTLELLSDLISMKRGRVPRRAVRFNSRGLCWRADDAPPAGTLLLVDCFVLPAWPIPLKLLARVHGAEAADDGHKVCTRLEQLDPGVRDWLEKLVFRRHRRAIARRRATA
ncbi:MAG: PilZ domain-containing protein [Gammaproteobacteria bacterium]|nr:PilZ domain-containing protein [Gammaproteobacteria bacterium]